MKSIVVKNKKLYVEGAIVIDAETKVTKVQVAMGYAKRRAKRRAVAARGQMVEMKPSSTICLG